MKSKIMQLILSINVALIVYSSSSLSEEKIVGYPKRPIRIIVSVAPGAGADAIARAAGQMLNTSWGQTIVVDNRPGGGGVIAAELAAKSAPDGYTILSFGDGLLVMGATNRVPFDIRTAFDPVVAMSAQPYVLITGLNLPAKNLKELIALSATQTLTYGSSGIGGAVHLGMERLAMLTGGKFLHVAYKGSAPSIVAVMSGEIHMVPTSAIAATNAIKTGKVKALVAMGLKRIPALPDLPTITEQGLEGFKITNRYNLWLPAKSPSKIILAINKIVSDGMNSPQMAQKLLTDGSQPGERMTPSELKKTILIEYAEIEQQVKNLSVKLR